MSQHLIRTAGWSLWKWVSVRGAGFPACGVLRLASPDLARAVDRLFDLEELSELERRAAIEVAEREIKAASGPAHKQLANVLKKLHRGGVPEVGSDGSDEIQSALDRLAMKSSASKAQRHEVEQLFGASALQVSQELRQVASDPRFREAVLWQNRGAVRTGLDPLLLRPPGATDSNTRQIERSVASYLQRYCVKNDTIGFFGPVGWGSLAQEGDGFAVRPGASLLAQRSVYFEHWCIDALASRLAADRELRLWAAPRRMPTIWVEERTLHFPVDRTAPLPIEYARVLAACDGEKAARTIVAELLSDRELDFGSEEEILDLLDQLVEKRLLSWTFEIPTGSSHPGRSLRALLERIDSGELRARGLAPLDALEGARGEAAQAAEDPTRLDQALAAVDRAFTEATGLDGTRRRGESYAGRTLIYEDCRRDVEVQVGRDFIDRLASPLSLLLQSARWYTQRLATRYRQLFGEVYQELRQATGSSRVDYLRFWERIAPLLPESAASAPEIVRQVVDELQERWLRLLGIDEETNSAVTRSAEALRANVADAFSAPCPGWPSARYHSPDVMIAARGLEALNRGDYLAVLGELHVSVNTVAVPMFLNQHPTPELLIRARELDLPEVCVAPVISSERASRSDHVWLSRHNLDLELGKTRSWRPRSHVLSVGELVVEEVNGTLQVRTRDAARAFDIIAFLEYYLIAGNLNFRFLPARKHLPRVTVDRLVIQRESWLFTPDELAFAREDTPFARFLGARRWARELRLPRFLFFKVPEEPKPCYLDVESPLYVEIFAKVVRKASLITVSEMLPAVEETWLPDASGQRYASELRLVAVDPEPWRAA